MNSLIGMSKLAFVFCTAKRVAGELELISADLRREVAGQLQGTIPGKETFAPIGKIES